MDRLDAMAIVVQAAEAGSLSAASRRLGMPLATVSRKVSELEAHLRTTLLSRTARGLVPTAAGQSYLTAAKAILEQLNEAERTASGEYIAPRGDLVIAAPVLFGRYHALPVVTDFLKAYPEVGVSLVLSNQSANLVGEHLDVAIRLGPLPDSSLTATQLGTVRPVVCASPDYLAERGTPVTLDELGRHDCIEFNGLSAHAAWPFQLAGIGTTAPVTSRLSVDSPEGAIEAAIAGMGLTRALSYQVAVPVRANALTIVLADFERPAWPVHLVYNGQSRLPLKLRAFIDFAAPRLRRRLADVAL